MSLPLVLDCDTGTDDALAIMLAALHPDVELVGVTSVWGNHDVAATTRNTLHALHHVGHGHVPVRPGLDAPDRPRPVPLEPDEGSSALPLPPSTGSDPTTGAGVTAPRWLVETTRERPITLVATGPCTNLAAALELDPELSKRVEHLVVMGGTREVRTSVTPHAERNVWNDPEAFDRVVGAGFPRLTLVPLDATYQALMGGEEVTRFAALGTPAGDAAAAMVAERLEDYRHVVGLGGRAPVHDPLCVALLLDPTVVGTVPARVSVETADATTYGRTRFDLASPHPDADVALTCDRRRFVDLLLDTFAR